MLAGVLHFLDELSKECVLSCGELILHHHHLLPRWEGTALHTLSIRLFDRQAMETVRLWPGRPRALIPRFRRVPL